MVVKAIDLVRKIRDKHYEETKGFSEEAQIKFVKDKSRKLRKRLRIGQRPTPGNKAQTTKV
jgi:hypothetical protein